MGVVLLGSNDAGQTLLLPAADGGRVLDLGFAHADLLINKFAPIPAVAAAAHWKKFLRSIEGC